MSGEHRFRREKAALRRVDLGVVLLALFVVVGMVTSLVFTYHGWTPVDSLGQ
jgi:hypothetical protein